MNGKKVLAAAGASSVISYGAYHVISKQMIEKVFNVNPVKEVIDQKYLEWLRSSNAMQVKVKSFDGIKLAGLNIRNHEGAPYIIMMHGMWRTKVALFPRAYQFDQLGYNVLLVDQRGTGDSDAANCTYGLKESQDLLVWINYLITKDPEAKICLYGISMGASAVMMAAAYHLPENVKCMIEEGGFSSLEEEFDSYIRRQTGLRFTKPVLEIVEHEMKETFGMTYEDVNPKKCLENNEIPLLIVHGEEDELVPFVMAKKIYNHNKGEKKYYPVSFAGHSDCCKNEDYYKNLNNFILSHIA